MRRIDLGMTSYRRSSSVGSKGVAGESTAWEMSARLVDAAWEMSARLVDAAMLTVVVGHVYLRNTYTKTMLQGNHNRKALTHQVR